MRSNRPLRRFAACTTVSLAIAGLSVPAAFAETTTTPIPIPEDPNQPPASSGPPVPPPGPIVAEAGTGIGVVRVLPGTVPGDSIIDGQQVPNQSVAEAGMGLATAKADSGTYLAQERSVAEAAPFGAAIAGNLIQVPGVSVNQTALPDHPEPTATGFGPPPSPADSVLKLGAVQGSAHARWDELQGPCVSPISDADTSVAGVSAVNALPAMPDTPQEFDRLASDPGSAQAKTAELRAMLDGGKGATLGGLLSGGAPDESGNGSLLNVPQSIRAHSRIELVDVPGAAGKAVRSTSEMQLASVQLLAGTPQEVRVDVVSAPKLTVTATGDPATSSVDYSAPVLRVSQGGRELAVLDAAHPTQDLPIGMPPGSDRLPVVGDALNSRMLDLGVLRLNLGSLTQQADGTELSADARLFELKVLPADALGMPGAALADISFGEQSAQAGAPEGGVQCGQQPLPAPADPPAEGAAAPPLAKTSGAYYTIPLFWTGAGLLLLGGVLVAAVPRRRS